MSDERETVGGLLGMLQRAGAPADASAAMSPELAATIGQAQLDPTKPNQSGTAPSYPTTAHEVSPELQATGAADVQLNRPVANGGTAGLGATLPVNVALQDRLTPPSLPPTQAPVVAHKGSQGPSRGTRTAGAEAADPEYVAPIETDTPKVDPYSATVQDPRIAAYLAHQADLQRRMQAAQGDVGRRRELDMAVGSLSGFGVKESEGEANARHAWANAPVTDIQDQEKARMGATEQAAKESSFFDEAATNDRNSDVSLAAQKLMGLPAGSIPAKMLPQALEHLKLKDEAKRRAVESGDKAKHEKAETQRERERGQTSITVANIHESAADRRANAEKKAKEKDVPARTVTMLQGADEESQAAAKLRELAPKAGIIAALTPGNTANSEYQAAKAAYGQARGKAIHGGPSGEAAAAFEKTVPSPYFTTSKSITNTADRIDAEAIEDRERQNKLLQSQGITNPLPPTGSQPPRGRAEQDPQGRHRVKGADGLWHLVK